MALVLDGNSLPKTTGQRNFSVSLPLSVALGDGIDVKSAEWRIKKRIMTE